MFKLVEYIEMGTRLGEEMENHKTVYESSHTFLEADNIYEIFKFMREENTMRCIVRDMDMDDVIDFDREFERGQVNVVLRERSNHVYSYQEINGTEEALYTRVLLVIEKE